MKKLELANKKFGKLTVIELHSIDRNGHTRYNCVCDCGNVCNVLSTHLVRGNTKSCGCSILKGKERKNWKGVGEISGQFWASHILRSADGSKGKRKPLECNITKEYVWDLFLLQNRKCKLSGIELKFPTKFKDKSYTASLDRIDSSKGYIIGNVQWIHKDINKMKNTYDQDYFIKMCKLISNNFSNADGCEVK